MSTPITITIDGTIANRTACVTSAGKAYYRFDLVRQEPGGRDKPDVERAYPCQCFRDDMPDEGARVECEAQLGSFKSKAGYNNVTLTVKRFVVNGRPALAPPPQTPHAEAKANAYQPQVQAAIAHAERQADAVEGEQDVKEDIPF